MPGLIKESPKWRLCWNQSSCVVFSKQVYWKVDWSFWREIRRVLFDSCMQSWQELCLSLRLVLVFDGCMQLWQKLFWSVGVGFSVKWLYAIVTGTFLEFGVGFTVRQLYAIVMNNCDRNFSRVYLVWVKEGAREKSWWEGLSGCWYSSSDFMWYFLHSFVSTLSVYFLSVSLILLLLPPSLSSSVSLLPYLFYI